MITVRRIHDDEAERFLNLLCVVFQLDPSRARPIFFEPCLYDLTRKWALFVDGEMCSILTTTPLTFGWGRCIGIAGVATHPAERGHGHGQRLLETVLTHAEREGEGPAMLFAHQETLYRRVGFRLTDEVVRGPVRTGGRPVQTGTVHSAEVRSLYDRWSSASPDRLRRTEDRWLYWNLACRLCEPFLGGYAVVEPGILREVVHTEPQDRWPMAQGTEWYGLRSVTSACGVPLKRSKVELLLMCRGVPGQPQMFMTDQF
ncbi:MAG: GNAT family N-acetyltransferase [Armatimonadetes bacterium]|nr:GNAT family N-acetyltransferase [Armatimonadota bacterium]